MNKSLHLLLSRFDRTAFQREVEEELQFHIEMQARDYKKEGLRPDEALTRARLRFGNVEQIKSQCLQIGFQGNVGAWVLKILFTIAFVLGVLIRISSPELGVTRIGDVLIMIAVFGGLLLMGKRMRSGVFRPAEPLRLGLLSGLDSIPLAFDEKGRTPFERAKADD